VGFVVDKIGNGTGFLRVTMDSGWIIQEMIKERIYKYES
jgi:hypothetical protein